MSVVTVRCPRCTTVLTVTASLVAVQVPCPACGQMIVVAPAPPPPPSTGPIPPHLLPSAARSTPPPPPTPSPTSPTAKEELPAPARQRGGFWLELSFIAVLGLIIVGAAFVGIIAWRSGGGLSSEKAIARTAGNTNVVEVDAGGASTGPPKWSNAEKVSLSMNKVVVRIKSADYGEVRGRDGEKYVIVSHDKTLLTLRLTIMSFRDRPYQYRSWYTSGGAELRDDRGITYRPHIVRTQELIGFSPAATLAQNQPIEDLLIFKLPPESSPDKCSYYRLVLPATAYNKSGTYHFEIPTAMIQSPLNLRE